MHDNRTPSQLETDTMIAFLQEGEFFGAISPVFFDGGTWPDEARAYDGQHRFEAVVATGISAWMFFVCGVTAEEAEHVDTVHRPRSYADTAKIRRIPQSQRRAEVARLLALHEHYGIDGVRTQHRLVLLPSYKDKYLEAPGMGDAVRAGEALYRAVKITTSLGAYAVLRTAGPGGEIDPDGFWESVRSGAGLREGEPALTLRNWAMRGRVAGRIPADPRLMTLYMMATAWNKHVLGESWSRPSPRFEVRQTTGQRYFPASQVPDFLSYGSPARRLGQLRTSFEAVAAARGAKSGTAK
jgi:hypothetical protein